VDTFPASEGNPSSCLESEQVIPVISAAVHSYGYDPRTHVLTIRFRSGGLYNYFEVPETLASEFARPHPWHRVRRRVLSHRCERIG
jgi:KTSC domain